MLTLNRLCKTKVSRERTFELRRRCVYSPEDMNKDEFTIGIPRVKLVGTRKAIGSGCHVMRRLREPNAPKFGIWLLLSKSA